ncbi:MAG TPA: hypothetical protein VLX90_17945 [Steroidobacteraceae bacterium]|nr:hypothetical protein [Steroidobacteraceae bacterium]
MRRWLVLLAISLAVQAVPAHAERDPQSGAPIDPRRKREIPSPITDRFYVRGTMFLPSFSTLLRVDAQNGTPGTVASGEDDLGMPRRKAQGRIELMFRLRERNRLRVDYFETDRNGSQLLTRQILFGDQTFLAGDQVTSSLDYRNFGLTYTYSFIRNDRFEIGAGLAVHFLQAEARGAVPARQLNQEVSGAGAFPTIPLDATWRISRRFALNARGQYFHAALNGFAGALADYHADVQYRWKPNFSLGAGYTVLRASLDVNDADFPGAFRLNVRGPEAFFKFSF